MNKIQVVIGIDVETDVGSWTPYYRGVEEGIPALLGLFKKQDIKTTFFFTGESADKYPAKTREVLKAGHEIGCHSLYHETIGDEIFPIPGVKPLLPEEVPFRLKRATEVVAKASGVKILSFRAPRLWGSTAMINALEDLGYLADASYPLFHYRKQLFPYHPSRDNWLEKGRSKILEIPCFADVTRKSKDRYGRDLDQWPVFRTEGAETLLKMVDNFAGHLNRKDKNKTPVLCFYFHPWEFISLPKKFHFGEGTAIPDPFIVKNCGQKALKELERLITGLKKSYRTDFLTCRQLAALQ
ncbi:MAG: polysaccharide deacetylase family protein [Candidatus Omnitrophica bacterium]|nr:polysaccharide deacetylase family protein [Candidatus Omnitrophota bacterium]